MAFNTHLLDRIGAHTGIGGQKTFHVYTTTDSVATVSASGYFPSTEFKDGDVVFCSIPNQVYAYTVSISGSTVTVANAFGNLSPSTETFPTWTGTPVPADGGWGVGYAYNLFPYLTNADSISISGEPAWMTVLGLNLVGVPNATGTTSNIIITPTNTNGDGPTETVSVTIDALAPTWNTNTPTISWAAASDPDPASRSRLARVASLRALGHRERPARSAGGVRCRHPLPGGPPGAALRPGRGRDRPPDRR